MLRIMGQSKATVEQLQTYIKKVNPKVTDSVTKLAAIYIAEGEMEGVGSTFFINLPAENS